MAKDPKDYDISDNLQKPSFMAPERFFDIGFKDVELGSDDEINTTINALAEFNLLSPNVLTGGVQTVGLSAGNLVIDSDLISGKLNTGALLNPNLSLPPSPSSPVGAIGAGGMSKTEMQLVNQINDLKNELQTLKTKTTENITKVNNDLTTAINDLINKRDPDFSEEFQVSKSGSNYFFDVRLGQVSNPPIWL